MDGCLDLPPWVDLPDLVSELILEHLPLPDYIRFAAVCRKWGSIQKEHRLRHSPHSPPMGAHPFPWIIPCVLFLDTGFDCYSPLEKRLCRLRFPTTPTFPGNALCMASSRGWLLMLHLDEDDDLELFDDNPTPPFPRRPFIFNPLTGVVFPLPMLSIVPGDHHLASLSSPPYDPDCTILLVSGGRAFMCRSNDPGDGWTMVVGTDELIDSAVYCGGKFYCISWVGVLYVIDRAFSTPTLLPLTMDVSALDLRVEEDMCRLVEFGGELLLVKEVFDWDRGLDGYQWCQLYRADLFEKKWVKKMDMLADHVLFLDISCSFSLLASNVGWKKNCIYFTHRHWKHVWRGFDLDSMNWIHEETCRRDTLSVLRALARGWMKQ